MFTGLIEEVGTIARIINISGGKQITLTAAKVLEDLKIGDSIAVNGLCLTVTQFSETGFTVDAVGETLTKSSVKSWRIGQKVNLERALRLDQRLGGHLVQGHVNGVGQTTRLQKLGENYWWEVELPPALLKYAIPEGSIALDGISLTIARLNGKRIGISIIPHTFQNTHLKFKKVGELVNIEVDVIAKYVERLLSFSDRDARSHSLSEDWLKKLGF